MNSSMKIGVFGTGVVGRTVATKLGELGHQLFVGTRDPAETLARTGGDSYGNPPFKAWREQHADFGFGTFAEAATHGELLINATVGEGAITALQLAGAANLTGKVLMDLSNPLDFSRGMPPSLTVCNTDSLGEQIQRAFPAVRVVKTLNTVTAHLMVAPRLLADGAHTIFVSGNDPDAKSQVTELLQSFGWQDIVDLGDITTARGTEMMLPIWVRLWGVTRTPMFSFKLVR
jgi:predicted dinucleotide-binding enzyme